MDEKRPEHFTTFTNTALLAGLKDSRNEECWKQYVDRYRPLIVRYCERVGASGDEAEDLAQSSLMTFARAYREGQYDRSKGRLRSWLFGIVRNQLRNFRRQRKDREIPESDSDSDDVLGQIEDQDHLEKLWEEEWHQAVLRQCLAEVRREVSEATFRAFQMFSLEQRSAREVADELDMTPNAVFSAKRRVLNRLRDLLPLIEDAW